MFDAATLRELIDYNPETGSLTWRHRSIRHFTNARYQATFNTKYAGNPCGCVGAYGYICVRVLGKNMQAHTIAWIIMTGAPPIHEIDHENGKRADNRWLNLRDLPHSENQKNMPIKQNNTSGYPGVGITKGRWYARIKIAKKTRSLGQFSTFDEAKKARVSAEKLHGFTVRL